MSEYDAGQDNSTTPPKHGQSRRKFTRNVTVGSAVLLSLGNRAAWGSYGGGSHFLGKGKKGGKIVACVSQQVWASFYKGAASMAPNTKHSKEIKKFAKYYGKRGSKTFEKGRQICVKVRKR